MYKVSEDKNEIDDIEIIERACEIHADLKKKGTPI